VCLLATDNMLDCNGHVQISAIFCIGGLVTLQCLLQGSGARLEAACTVNEDAL
jgi:hypothetical protein